MQLKNFASMLFHADVSDFCLTGLFSKDHSMLCPLERPSKKFGVAGSSFNRLDALPVTTQQCQSTEGIYSIHPSDKNGDVCRAMWCTKTAVNSRPGKNLYILSHCAPSPLSCTK